MLPPKNDLDFYLGTHMPHWLSYDWSEFDQYGIPVKLFVSLETLSKYKNPPIATRRWGMDSGGFSQVRKYGRWNKTIEQFIDQVRFYRDGCGNLEWVPCQDWMCEPFMLKKTCKTIKQHQLLTTWNYCDLLMYAPDLPVIPVLQGWEKDDYLRHIEFYEEQGVDLFKLPRVGVGSVCRRQSTNEAEQIMYSLWSLGLKIHAFGFKTLGLLKCQDMLVSADSMAWSYTARREKILLGGCNTHINCANCHIYASIWYFNLMQKLGKTSYVYN